MSEGRILAALTSSAVSVTVKHRAVHTRYTLDSLFILIPVRCWPNPFIRSLRHSVCSAARSFYPLA